MKRALITGITGMDGSHLADLLLGKGYEVHGLARRCAHESTGRIEHLLHRVRLHTGDLLDQTSLCDVVGEVQPDEIYNLAAQSFVGSSWQQPVLTAEITGLGALRMLEAMRRECLQPCCFYQASSSEMFGNAPDPQDESTPFRPRSPYGVAKAFAHGIAVNYRESYGMHVSCGILFNHESERRGHEFVTRKISRQVAELRLGLRDKIVLGNLDAKRDWGYAPDYVEAMWRMLQKEDPGDYVIATGETHTVREFLELALATVGRPDVQVELDPGLLRPAELHVLRGRADKARDALDWRPDTDFKTLVERMVYHDADQLYAVGLA